MSKKDSRKNSKQRRIKSAYDAFYFLSNHPALRVRERARVVKSEAKKLAAQGFIITTDRNGRSWHEHRHVHRRSMECNLNIHYAKVDKHGVVNDDRKKNKNFACWLETGPMEYGYDGDGEQETRLQHIHDIDLDTGARTFDKALVKLAKLVLAKYGDYEDDRKERKICGGKAECADCREQHARMKRMMSAPSVAVLPPE